MTPAVIAEQVTSHGPRHRVTVYPQGRHCSDCGHTLSCYNRGPDCHACRAEHAMSDLVSSMTVSVMCEPGRIL